LEQAWDLFEIVMVNRFNEYLANEHANRK